jgi:hypothetical protein
LTDIPTKNPIKVINQVDCFELTEEVFAADLPFAQFNPPTHMLAATLQISVEAIFCE